MPRWVVFLESHRTTLFERLDDSLEDVEMISEHLVVAIAIDIIQVHDFADSIVFARYHNSLIDSFAWSVDCCTLGMFSDTIIFWAFGSIKFY